MQPKKWGKSLFSVDLFGERKTKIINERTRNNYLILYLIVNRVSVKLAS